MHSFTTCSLSVESLPIAPTWNCCAVMTSRLNFEHKPDFEVNLFHYVTFSIVSIGVASFPPLPCRLEATSCLLSSSWPPGHHSPSWGQCQASVRPAPCTGHRRPLRASCPACLALEQVRQFYEGFRCIWKLNLVENVPCVLYFFLNSVHSWIALRCEPHSLVAVWPCIHLIT